MLPPEVTPARSPAALADLPGSGGATDEGEARLQVSPIALTDQQLEQVKITAAHCAAPPAPVLP